MIRLKLNPDLDKLKRYLGKWEVETFTKQGYAQISVFLADDDYPRYSEGLKALITKYKLDQFRDELLYVIYKEDDILGECLIDDKLRSEYIENTIDLTKFLLAFKNSKDNPNFQIGVKENTGTVNRPKNKNYFIKNEEISKWMCQVICDALESGNVPQGLIDERESVFGLNYGIEEYTITIENLQRGLDLQNKNFNVYRKKRCVGFCLEIKSFLDEYTPLKCPDGVRITDTQANFFFELLSILDYINPSKIDSEPKDYFNAMLRNAMT